LGELARLTHFPFFFLDLFYALYLFWLLNLF
jgi:hypothetical protein